MSTSFLIHSVFCVLSLIGCHIPLSRWCHAQSFQISERAIYTLDSVHLYSHYDNFLANERTMFCANKKSMYYDSLSSYGSKVSWEGHIFFSSNSHESTELASNTLCTITSKATKRYNLSSCKLDLVTGHLLAGGIILFLIQPSAREWKLPVRL